MKRRDSLFLGVPVVCVYDTYIGSGALVLQSALIIGIFAARARQRIAEKEPLHSESRFTGVFEGSPVSLSIVRQSDSLILDVNPAWERTTHVSGDEAIGSTHLEAGFEFESSSSDWFLECLATGKCREDDPPRGGCDDRRLGGYLCQRLRTRHPAESPSQGFREFLHDQNRRDGARACVFALDR
jgi:PAS domain-containing protein